MKKLLLLIGMGLGFGIVGFLGCANPKPVPAVQTATAVVVQCSGQKCTINLPGAPGQIAVLVCPAGFTGLDFYPYEQNPDHTYQQKQSLHGNSDAHTISLRFPIGTLICSKPPAK